MFYYKFIIKITTVSKNERKNKQTCCIVFKELLLFPFCFGQFIKGCLLVSIETIFWLLVGQKERNSDCDWFIQLYDHRCHWTLSDKMIFLSDYGKMEF